MKFTAKLISSLRDDYDLELRTDYSGRGMYGRRCVGIDCHTLGAEIQRFYTAMHELADDSDYDIAQCAKAFWQSDINLCWDSMGLGMIIYFPNITAEDADTLEDEY